MNRAVGFPCPVCGRIEIDVLRLELSQVGHPMSIRLHCNSCEAVFSEPLHREEAEWANRSPSPTGWSRSET
jgi:hypothetical protein